KWCSKPSAWSLPRGATAEVRLRERAYQGEARAPWIEWRRPPRVEPERDQGAGHEAAVRVELHPEQRALGEHARTRERVARRQIAEAVRDQAPPVPLHSAQDVWARGEHEVCARVDHRVRERCRVSPRLAEIGLA